MCVQMASRGGLQQAELYPRTLCRYDYLGGGSAGEAAGLYHSKLYVLHKATDEPPVVRTALCHTQGCYQRRMNQDDGNELQLITRLREVL